MIETVDLGYIARPQFEAFHAREESQACLVCHRRAGKTVACIMDEIDRALRLKLPYGRYAYVGPFLNQAKDVAWEYLKRYSELIRVDKNESELWIELENGARIRVHGADNPDRLRGGYLDGVIMDEYADMRPTVFSSIISPMLAERNGWVVFIGTPKGHNEFWKIYQQAQTEPDWYHVMLKASETGILTPAQLDLQRRRLTAEEYDQEFEVSFEAAIMGAYFGKEMAEATRTGRICDVPYDPEHPVFTAWDLGKGINMAIWIFQVIGDQVRIIDHIEGEHSDGITHMCEKLRELPYKYAADYVPHDGRATDLGSGRTRIETLINCHRHAIVLPAQDVMDGINAARLTIPHCVFDQTRCKHGIEALRQYRADFDEKANAFKDLPRHDWASHSADAFRYLAMAWRERIAPAAPPPKPPMRGVESITVDELISLAQPARMRV